MNVAYARRWLVGSVLAVLGFVVARRLAGAMTSPTTVAGCLLTGSVLAVCASWMRSALIARLGLWPSFAVGGAIALLGAAAISVAGTPAWGLLALWLPIVGEAALAIGRESNIARPAARLSNVALTAPSTEVELEAPTEALPYADPAVTQHLVRRQNEGGTESISGYLRAQFAPGERTVNLHVPFCPPLALVPACEAEATDGPPARVKVVQVLPQGARLEVRLDEVARTPEQVVVEFTTI